MSIASAIAALSPTVYWKLDDATGPAASDSSGNSHAGAYGGGFALHQPGPEASTFAAKFSNGGDAQLLAAAFMSHAVSSMMVWMAQVAPHTQYGEFLGSSTATTGGSLDAQPSGVTLGQLAITRNNIANTVVNQWITDAHWHHYALVFNGASSFMAIDGVSVFTIGGPNTPVNPNLIAASQGVALLAHAAWWDNVALTIGQIAGVSGGFTPPLQIPPAASGTASYQDLLDAIATLQSTTNSVLAAVQKTY